jgi:hypothetical protein
MRQVGRICYGIAAALGLLSLGMEWQNRQKRAQARSLFPQPPSHTGMLVALWAAMVALMGKVMEDAGQRQLITAEITGSQVRSTGFGPYRTYLPKLLQKRAQTLHSDFDLGDQYDESKSNARPLSATH